MISAGFKIMIVGVYAEGLGEDWLGRTLDAETLEELDKIATKYSINVSGEGGEFETLVTDGPCFIKKLEIVESKIEWDGMTGNLTITEAKLVEK